MDRAAPWMEVRWQGGWGARSYNLCYECMLVVDWLFGLVYSLILQRNIAKQVFKKSLKSTKSGNYVIKGNSKTDIKPQMNCLLAEHAPDSLI